MSPSVIVTESKLYFFTHRVFTYTDKATKDSRINTRVHVLTRDTKTQSDAVLHANTFKVTQAQNHAQAYTLW